ncbi:hypothetical protein MNV_1150004 [Candidatus Methanoperedens nitroreducens]|uniref:Uncharacterized protein n=1 Tax=Candidatus Methanoperedens nitratireducens TaxID=1392998 RepID=A0A284VJ78_9EURY|nr:hypothetical protein MNV_1150004 [Candidatus Methanoperedens nitroreducens]
MFFFKIKINQVILTVIFSFIVFKTLVIAKKAQKILVLYEQKIYLTMFLISPI